MTIKVKNPARLDMTDLPRDPQRCLGSLRQNLVAAVNYCKKYPKKMTILKATLKFAYAFLLNFEELEAKKRAAKKAAIKQAEKDEAKALAEAEKAASEDADPKLTTLASSAE